MESRDTFVVCAKNNRVAALDGEPQFVVAIANFRELLANNRLDDLVGTELLCAQNFRLNAKFFVIDIERESGSLKNGIVPEKNVVAKLARGSNPDLNAAVGGLQVIAGLRCERDGCETEERKQKNAGELQKCPPVASMSNPMKPAFI